MRVFLDFLGCRLNEAELEQWRRDFVARGHHIAARPEDADVCVLNTCAVTTEAARQSRQVVRRLHRRNPQAAIVVAGCDATYERERLASLEGVALVLPNREKDALVERVVHTLDGRPPARPPALDAESRYLFPHSRTRAFLKVQDGCNNRCTFCVVRILRGEERSRPVEEIVQEIHTLLRLGYREVVLTGVHLGGYGRDLGYSLESLVRDILAETRVERLRLSSLEPWDIPNTFFDLWAESEGRLMPHLHLPLQSGSDTTLKRMGRRYTTAEYRSLVRRARERIPHLTVTTDIIVGFPGETEEEFQQTLAFVEEMAFAHIHIFTYSPREGTPATKLPHPVPSQVKKDRSRRLHRLMFHLKARHLASQVGLVRPVLWEDVLERGEDTWTWSGLTDNYLRVRATVPRAWDLHNRITPTRLERVEAGQYLIGHILTWEEEHRP